MRCPCSPARAYERKAVGMVSTYSPRLNQVIQHAPPDDTPENAKYIHLVVLWLRVKERTAELQRQLDRLQVDIATEVRAGSPQALVAASELADRPRACYARSTMKVTKRLTIRIAEAKKCKSAKVAGNRSSSCARRRKRAIHAKLCS